MTRQFLKDNNARIPFAILGVLLLLSSSLTTALILRLYTIEAATNINCFQLTVKKIEKELPVANRHVAALILLLALVLFFRLLGNPSVINS